LLYKFITDCLDIFDPTNLPFSWPFKSINIAQGIFLTLYRSAVDEFVSTSINVIDI
jgi:hypothetical protein